MKALGFMLQPNLRSLELAHQFNNQVDLLQPIVNLGFLSEIIAANTHPTRSILNGFRIIGSHLRDLCYHAG